MPSCILVNRRLLSLWLLLIGRLHCLVILCFGRSVVRLFEFASPRSSWGASLRFGLTYWLCVSGSAVGSWFVACLWCGFLCCLLCFKFGFFLCGLGLAKARRISGGENGAAMDVLGVIMNRPSQPPPQLAAVLPQRRQLLSQPPLPFAALSQPSTDTVSVRTRCMHDLPT